MAAALRTRHAPTRMLPGIITVSLLLQVTVITGAATRGTRQTACSTLETHHERDECPAHPPLSNFVGRFSVIAEPEVNNSMRTLICREACSHPYSGRVSIGVTLLHFSDQIGIRHKRTPSPLTHTQLL
ncbi:hypothetical protein BJV78DRAFT_1181219, partial [Lactifluus subvellereus]